MNNKNLKWWFLCVIHNCVSHPLLVVAEVFDEIGLTKVSDILFRFHDVTIPDEDRKNVVKML